MELYSRDINIELECVLLFISIYIRMIAHKAVRNPSNLRRRRLIEFHAVKGLERNGQCRVEHSFVP